jgi:hypothetical protein
MSNSVGNANVVDLLHVRCHALRDEFGKELLEDYSRDEGHCCRVVNSYTM